MGRGKVGLQIVLYHREWIVEVQTFMVYLSHAGVGTLVGRT